MRSLFQQAAFFLAVVSVSIVAVPIPASAAPQSPVVLVPDHNSVQIDQGVEYLQEKPGQPLNASQAMSSPDWQAHQGKMLNLSFQPAPIWIRFGVRNSTTTRQWALEIPWAMLDDIEFQQWNATDTQPMPPLRAGRFQPLQMAVAKGPTYVFPVDLDAGQSTMLLLRVSAPEYLIPLTLIKRSEFHAVTQDRSVFLAAVFSVLVVMLLYNANLSVFTRDRNYVAYSMYLLAVIFVEAATTGYGKLYLWTDSIWWNERSLPIFASLAYLTALYFLRCFLDLKANAPRLYGVYKALIGVWAVLLVGSIALPDISFLYPAARAMGPISLFFLLGVAIYLALRGHVSARIFAIAWGAIIVAAFVTGLWVLGLIEGNGLIENSQHIGFVLETVLLSVALAERIRRERLLKEAAQSNLSQVKREMEVEREKKINAQEEALAIQRRANEELESRVQGRTADLQQAMKSLATANAELAELSVTDGLTKVHNRRYFDEVLKAEHERAVRHRTPLNLIMVDIDHFKRINDTVGHVGGDECLKLVAATLKNNVHRVDDLVARYGGEEFALILPSADPQAMKQIAERLRGAVESIRFIYRGRQVPLSVSVGVLSDVPDGNRDHREWIARADAALYEAKRSGRNCVKFAEQAVNQSF